MARPNDAIVGKKDLHVGGVGSAASAPWPETWARDASPPWASIARNALENANGYVRDNTWAAIGVSAFIGLAAGYFLSRRT